MPKDNISRGVDFQASLTKSLNELVKCNDSSLVIERNRSDSSTKIKFDGATEQWSANQEDNEIKKRIAACREMYENVGIIGNIIDIMVDFALEGVTLVHESKAIQNIYRNWQTKIKMRQIIEGQLKGLFRDANVPILAFRAAIEKDELSRYRKAIAADSLFLETIPERSIIPYAYQNLDILRFDKSGSSMFSSGRYEYKLTASEIKILKSPITDEEKASAQSLRDSLGEDAWAHLIKSGVMILNPDRVSVLYYKKDDYKKWANPLLWRVQGDVRFKSLLRDMDISVVESVTNALVIIKLGSIKDGIFPRKEEFEKMASMLKNPAKSKTILWNDLIDIIDSYPPVDKILGKEKYEQVDGDIRSGLGISEILVNGQGGNYANSYLSVRTLLERLESARDMIIEFWEGECVKVAKALGFQRPAKVRMRHMSLLDAEAERRFILELYDHNLLSAESVLSNTGENLQVELQRMREEDKIREDIADESPFALLKIHKYNVEPSLFVEDLDQSKQIPKPASQGPEGEKGGRPPDTKRKQSKVKTVTPQGKKTAASILVDEKYYKQAESRFDALYNMFVKAVMLRNPNYKSEEDLSENETNNIYSAIDKVLCAIINKEDYNSENIVLALSDKLTTAPEKLDRCVSRVKEQKIKKFREKNNRKPNKKEMKDITSSAWAICRSQLKM